MLSACFVYTVLTPYDGKIESLSIIAAVRQYNALICVSNQRLGNLPRVLQVTNGSLLVALNLGHTHDGI